MTLSVLSYVNKTASGTITIPASCNMIVAMVTGSEAPPVINGVAMQTKASIGSNGTAPAVSVHTYNVNEIYEATELPFTLFGTSATFAFVDNGNFVGQNVIFCQDEATCTEELATSSNDIVFGVVAGSIGPVSVTFDGNAPTYMDSSNAAKTCYATPTDSSQTVVAKDDGVSTGYYITTSTWIPETLVSAGYWSYDPVLHIVQYYSVSIGGGQWNEYKREDGVVTFLGVVPTPFDGTMTYYTYPGVWHPPVYTGGYYQYSKTWVSAGALGQVSAAFISVSETGSGVFVGRPVII